MRFATQHDLLQICQNFAKFAKLSEAPLEPRLKKIEMQLDDADSQSLRNILRSLRIDRSLKYVEMARILKCDIQYIYGITGRRKKGTQDILKNVLTYCKSNDIDISQFSRTSQFDMILEQMEIDNDVIDASKEFSGKYKLFSFISGESVGVTWVELAKKAKTLPIPQFWTWRPVTGSGPVIVGGMYYGLDNTLFMAGNKTESPFARCIVTSSIEGSKDRMGFISGASPSEYIFHSFCLMKKMPNDITRRRSRVEFGEFNWKIFVKKYPEESAIMEQYRGFFYSHRKPSGI